MNYKFSIEEHPDIFNQLKENAIQEHYNLFEALKEKLPELANAYKDSYTGGLTSQLDLSRLSSETLEMCVNYTHLDILLNKGEEVGIK